MKHCNKCNKSKPDACFSKSSKYRCKDCAKAYNRARYAEKREQISVYNKAYRATPEAKLTRNKRQREAYHANPNTRIVQCIQSSITALLSGRIKKSWIVNYIGIGLKDLITYIENQFADGMSWDNRTTGKGNWSIDHIVPLSSLDLSVEENLRKVLHYTNLQPLWNEENSSKHNKVDWIPKNIPQETHNRAEELGLSTKSFILKRRQMNFETAHIFKPIKRHLKEKGKNV